MPGRTVAFGVDAVCRPARDDERNVMEYFSGHASHCPYCADPYRTYISGGTLCDRGHMYARDVAQYVYSKAGKAYSMLDRQVDPDARVQIEIPARCDAIRGLLRAVDAGLRLSKQKPVVSQDRAYYVKEREAPRPAERREVYDVMEVAPRRSRSYREEGNRRETVYVPGRGSLYRKDEEERRRRRREDGDVQIVYAQPSRRQSAYYA